MTFQCSCGCNDYVTITDMTERDDEPDLADVLVIGGGIAFAILFTVWLLIVIAVKVFA